MRTLADMHEPLYAAHQIKVPNDLPEIMKNFSKHIIRTQPKNILEAAAKYEIPMKRG
jgi:hypothetical protein